VLTFGPMVPDRECAATPGRPRVSLYIEPRDLWVGVFVSPSAVYACLLPCLVIRIQRGPRRGAA